MALSAPSTSPDKIPLRKRLAPFARAITAIELGACEIVLISLLFTFEAAVPAWQHPAAWLRHLELLAIVAAVAFIIISWPRRREIVTLWQETGRGQSWWLPLAVNLILFCILTAATVFISTHASEGPSGPRWDLLWLYFIPVLATGFSLVWLAAPIAFWRGLLRGAGAEILLAIAVGIMLLALSAVARAGWEPMAGITLDLVQRLLGLYEAGVQADWERRAVSIGQFTVIIDQSCSGYEGVALVSTFLALFLWTFRRSLRFPNAFLLLPLGIAAILLLNVVRIAALVSLGAHVSAEMAANGFHSQAGWMSFLAVTIAIMALAPRMAFFAAEGAPAILQSDRHAVAATEGDREMLGLVVPFMAMMGGAILVSASAPYDTALYGLKIIAAAIALWIFRDVWRSFLTTPSATAILAGATVGIAWIATSPDPAPPHAGTWLVQQTTAVAAIWLAIRAIGSVIVVPVVEELAFRGLLYRWVISRRFETVAFTQLSFSALVVSSVLFGLMHQRWIAGALAGVVFALVMIRSGRLSDAIAAHVLANAVIVVWVLATRQWGLL